MGEPRGKENSSPLVCLSCPSPLLGFQRYYGSFTSGAGPLGPDQKGAVQAKLHILE